MKLTQITAPKPIDPGDTKQGIATKPFVYFRGQLFIGDNRANHSSMHLPRECEYDSKEPAIFGRIVIDNQDIIAIWPQSDDPQQLKDAITAIMNANIVKPDAYVSYNRDVTPASDYTAQPTAPDELNRAQRLLHLGGDEHGRRISDIERKNLRKIVGTPSAKPNPTPGRKWWAPTSESITNETP